MEIIMMIRFVDWNTITNSYEIITIEDEPIRKYKKYQTDEGWYSILIEWSYKNNSLIRTTISDGVDCDGRFSTINVDICPISQINNGNRVEIDNIYYIAVPWTELSNQQKDYYAEESGY